MIVRAPWVVPSVCLLIAQAPALAEEPAAPSTPPFLPMLIILGLVMYFLVIRPQRREERARKEMLLQLKKNDHVVTGSGIHGVVANVTDDEVILKVDESKDVRIRFSRSAVARILTGDEEKDKPPAKS